MDNNLHLRGVIQGIIGSYWRRNGHKLGVYLAYHLILISTKHNNNQKMDAFPL